MTLSIPANSYTNINEIIKRSNNQKLYEEDYFTTPLILNSLSVGAGASETNTSANTNFPLIINGKTPILSTTLNSQWSRTAGTSRNIIPGRWQIDIIGRFGYEAANATPLATHVNNTTLFMGMHFSRFVSLNHIAAIGFHYNDSGAGIFVANNGASSIILPSTPLLLPINTIHNFRLTVQQNTPQVDLYVNGNFVVSTTSVNIPQYNNLSRAMIMGTDVIKTVADAVNLPIRYTLDHYAVLLEQV